MPGDLSATRVGDDLPAITCGPISRATLAIYAGASGDYNPMHIDSDMAAAAGLPDVFAHGMLVFGVLARVPAEWAGHGRLRAFGARFVAITPVRAVLTCTGKVAECFHMGGERRARIAVAATTQDGTCAAIGEAVVALD